MKMLGVVHMINPKGGFVCGPVPRESPHATLRREAVTCQACFIGMSPLANVLEHAWSIVAEN